MEIALTAVPEPCALAANGERVLAEIMKDASSSYFGPWASCYSTGRRNRMFYT